MNIPFRSFLPSVAALAFLAALVACGDDESVSPVGERPVAKTRADLPECNEGREGELRPVEEDEVSFRCESGVWNYDVVSDKRRNRGSEYDPATNTLKDLRDNRTYRTVTIGDQVWMAENLAFRYYLRDKLAPCYEDKEENCDKYGRMYRVSGASTVCPKGWHVPDSTEYRILFDAAKEIRSGFSTVLKAAEGWDDYDGESLNGTDDLGFSLLPGGSMCLDSAGNEEFTGLGNSTLLADNDFPSRPIPSQGASYEFTVQCRLNMMQLTFIAEICYGYVRCVKDN